MDGLFRDEPDEDECTAYSAATFREELDEPEGEGIPAATFQQEPDEDESPQAFCTQPEQPFDDEKDEEGSDHHTDTDSDGDLAYEADVDEDSLLSRRQLFDMSFATLNQFMAGNLAKTDYSAGSRPLKKRCYNNERRAAKAAAAKMQKPGSDHKRVPRDDPATQQTLCNLWDLLLFKSRCEIQAFCLVDAFSDQYFDVVPQ